MSEVLYFLQLYLVHERNAINQNKPFKDIEIRKETTDLVEQINNERDRGYQIIRSIEEEKRRVDYSIGRPSSKYANVPFEEMQRLASQELEYKRKKIEDLDKQIEQVKIQFNIM